jgi:hypothetical protein
MTHKDDSLRTSDQPFAEHTDDLQNEKQEQNASKIDDEMNG